jgi:hypothetical protein
MIGICVFLALGDGGHERKAKEKRGDKERQKSFHG